MRPWYTFKAKAKEPETADVLLFDAIGKVFGGVDAEAFVRDLAALPASVKTIRLRVNSPGGDAFDAIAMGNALAEHPARVETTIEALAASAATIVTATASDLIRVADNATVMIHRAATVAVGDRHELAKVAEALEAVDEAIVTSYRRRSKLSRAALLAMMAAETWLLPQEAVEAGLADEVYTPEAGSSEASEVVAFHPRAAAALHPPAAFETRVAAFLRPPTPAPPASGRASVEMVMEACATAELDIDFANELIRAGVDEAAARRRIGAERERRILDGTRLRHIEALLSRTGMPEYFNFFAKSKVTVEEVKAFIADRKAQLDVVELDSSLPPGQVTGAKPKPPIDYLALYDAAASAGGRR